MSQVFSKVFSKIFFLIFIVVFFLEFRTRLITDDGMRDALAALMGALPFAEYISDIICGLLKFHNEVPLITTGTIVTDFLKLALMACIQPVLTGITMALFLPLPAYRGESAQRRQLLQDDYMNTFSYKLKSLLIMAIMAPISALMAAFISDTMQAYLQSRLGNSGTVIMGIAMVIVVTMLSIIPMLFRNVTLKVALTWRICITLCLNMAKTMMTNALCLALYVAILGGVSDQIISCALVLALWLIGINLLIKAVSGKIVS